METYRLTCHATSPAGKVRSVDAYVVRNRDNYLHLRWRIKGTTRVCLPEYLGAGREDGLWQATCFELFVRQPGDETYLEFNFSPSGRWAAYAFDGYRSNMTEYPMAQPPVCQVHQHAAILTLDVQLRSAILPQRPWEMGLSAVVEEDGGVKSYWAITHTTGQPDFHHPACFAAMLASPEHP